MNILESLHNRIDLTNIPYTDRASRLMLFRQEDTLFIRLAERWEKWQDETGHYRERVPFIEKFSFLRINGERLPFTTDSYPHMVEVRTEVGTFVWTFADTEALAVRLPAGRFGFSFEVHAHRGQRDRRGGTLRGVRNTAYTTNAQMLDNEIAQFAQGRYRATFMLEAHEGDVLLLNITPRLGYNRSLPDADELIAQARSRWESWFAATPPVLDAYRAQYDYAWWIMQVGLLSQRYYFSREAMTPSKIHYVGVWHWDQFYHAIAYRYMNTKLAEDQLRILMDHQQDNGMLPDAIHDEGLVTHLTKPVEADVTKPPLLAWTALKLYEQSGHLDFMHEVFDPLLRWHEWWMRDNRNACGLCEYRHPFTSGLDDNPLWDDGMPVVSPDLNTYLCLQMESIAKIADLIGEHLTAEHFRESAALWAERMLQLLWNEELGLFDALHEGKRVPALTPFALLPLCTGRLPEKVNERLVAHLTDPNTFWPRWPIPTVAVNDPKFDPVQMWRGPVWPNINYLFVEGLERIGRYDLAGLLRRSTLNLIMEHPDIYEYYNPLNGSRPPKAAPIFGWTSAVFIDLAIQETKTVKGER